MRSLGKASPRRQCGCGGEQENTARGLQGESSLSKGPEGGKGLVHMSVQSSASVG